MVLSLKRLDLEHRPIENWSGDEEIPRAGKNRRLYGKSRLECLQNRKNKDCRLCDTAHRTMESCYSAYCGNISKFLYTMHLPTSMLLRDSL